MTKSAQQHNLQELIVALQSIKDAKGDPALSPDLRELLKSGLHHAHLPDTLKVSAAEMLQLTIEGLGGLPRMMLWGDRNYGALMKLYARQTNATIAPVVPKTIEAAAHQQWPDWLTQRRLAYQEEAPASDTTASSSDEENSDGD